MKSFANWCLTWVHILCIMKSSNREKREGDDEMYARGDFQRRVEEALLAGRVITNPVPRKGKAGRYAVLYKKSLQNLFTRMQQDGWKVIYTPGPRGGEWSATFHLVPAELDEMAAALYPAYRDDAPGFFTLLVSAAAGYSTRAKADILGMSDIDIRNYLLTRLSEIETEKEEELLASFS